MPFGRSGFDQKTCHPKALLFSRRNGQFHQGMRMTQGLPFRRSMPFTRLSASPVLSSPAWEEVNEVIHSWKSPLDTCERWPSEKARVFSQTGKKEEDY